MVLRDVSFLILIVLKSEVNGTLELFTPETLCCQVLHRGKDMTDGQKLLANEQMDCSRAGLAQASPLVLMASMATMAPMAPMFSMASMATMVPEAVTALLASKLTIGILQLRLQLAATPRETDGFRSLRRVDKIGGMRAEGSCNI